MKEKEERIREKLEEIRKNLEELEQIIPDDYESYESNNERRAACERYFERVIEAVVDAAFLVLNEYELKIPDEDKGAFDIISDAEFISKELAGRLKDAKGMRNILAHEYGKVDDNLVFNAISEEIFRDVNEFLNSIGKLNKKWGKDEFK